MRVEQISQSLTVKEVRPSAWFITCRAASPSDDAIESIQDACLNALDRGALIVAVDLSRFEAISTNAIGVFAVISEMLAARGGRLWLVWPQGGAEGNYRVLSFDGGSRLEFEQMLGGN